jgi:hypothetical protein
MTAAERPPRRAPAWAWCAVTAVAIGAASRVAGLFDDFWLDEIWSWRIARSARSAADLLASPAARVDNNHPLNTLLLYLLGDLAYWPAYRIPSVLAGVGTVVLAAWHVSRRFGRTEGAFAAVLLGLSYPLVHYSSEARGYAPMTFFAMAGFVSLDRFLGKRSWRTAATFAASAILGLLSHLTFAHFYVAAVIWSASRLFRESRSRRDATRAFLSCHVAPVAFAAWFYWVFVRHMTIGGAPDTSLPGVVATALSLLCGGPTDGTARGVVAFASAASLAAALVVAWRRDRSLSLFFLTCVVVSPAIFVAAQAVSMRGMETLFPRYFLVSTTFAYVLLAIALGWLWRRGDRAPVVLLLGCVSAAHLHQTAAFLRGTRGHYADAVRHMTATTPGGAPTVASDNPFRTTMLLDFYARGGTPVAHVNASRAEPADWFIVNTPQAGRQPPAEVTVGGVAYRFDREFTYHGLSGWSWYLFRRVDG